MDHQKKLDFVLRMTKQALEHVQHFDSGGTVLSGPSVNGAGSVGGASGLGGILGGVFGSNSGYQAAGAPIQAGTNAAQLNEAYNGAQYALGQQQGAIGAVAPGTYQGAQLQNALGNQLYNQGQNLQGYGNQNALSGQLLQAGANNQGAGTQNNLTGLLQSESLGGGPNPAQAALNANTGQNIAQQAALAASTRGAGANAGLIASNAANQGINAQQQAINQSAQLQAQQQLNAQAQLQNLGNTQVAQQQNAQGLLGNVAGQQVGQQLASQNALQGLAGTQVNQGLNAVQEANQAQQSEQGILQGANTGLNATNVAQQSNINTTNAGTASTNATNSKGTAGGILSAIPIIGPLLGKLFAEGGEVPDHLHKMAAIYHPHLLQSGGKVPGKPQVNRDAYKNDVVDAKLSPGEVVIDINTLKDKGKLGKMARFVAQNIERKKMGRAL